MLVQYTERKTVDTLSISQQVLDVIDQLEPSDSLEAKVTRLAESELRRRLARYQLTDRQFQAKYGISLAEFEARRIVEERGYAFEVESDHQDWDQAIDGIRNTERQLAALLGQW